MVQRGKTVALTRLLHLPQLRGIEIRLIDIAPIIRGRIHREAGRNGAIGSDDHVILSCAAIPVSEMHVAMLVLDDAWHRWQQSLSIAMVASISIPTVFLDIQA